MMTLTDHWVPYRPSAEAPWNLRRVHRLHRRAGFGASWKELQRDLARGPGACIAALLEGESPTNGVGEFTKRQRRLARAAILAGRPEQLQAWWVYRMLRGGHPLRERLTLMWHDHFATSQEKVDDVALMHQQNEILRRHAMVPFGRLLRGVLKDPALLIYLDAPNNKKSGINENLGREILELFTLRIGHYSQSDVVAASRALTGWGVDGRKFIMRPLDHDDGNKTILGKTGSFDGDDLIDLILAHPATARTVAARLCEEFLGEGTPTVAVDALAKGLGEHGLDVGWAVGTILRSERFHLGDAGEAAESRFLGPVDYVIGAVHALERDTKLPSTLAIASWITRMGQKLFLPPNVGGWRGGRAWFTQRGVLTRANFASALIEGDRTSGFGPMDLDALAKSHGVAGDRESVQTFLSHLMLGAVPGWIDAATRGTDWSAGMARRLAISILGSPDAQLA